MAKSNNRVKEAVYYNLDNPIEKELYDFKNANYPFYSPSDFFKTILKEHMAIKQNGIAVPVKEESVAVNKAVEEHRVITDIDDEIGDMEI